MAQVARLDFETIERPTITVNMAGDEKQLPVTFNDADLKLMGKAGDEQDAEAAMEDLEKSIVARLADDIVVGVKGDRVELIITKKF